MHYILSKKFCNLALVFLALSLNRLFLVKNERKFRLIYDNNTKITKVLNKNILNDEFVSKSESNRGKSGENTEQ